MELPRDRAEDPRLECVGHCGPVPLFRRKEGWRTNSVRCERCEAEPGEPCKTPSGEARGLPHYQRANEAYLRFIAERGGQP